MTSTRLIRASLSMALIAAILVAALPVFVSAAPGQQADAAGALVFESETLPSASSPGRVLTLTLAADGTARLSTDFLNGEAAIVEVGEWSANDVEQTLDVTLTGTEASEYESPTTLVFSVQDDGSIVTIEWDEMLYGAEGLTLRAVQGAESATVVLPEPTPTPAAGADATVTATATAKASDVAQAAATPEGTATPEAAATPEADTTPESADATSDDADGLAGTYVSETLPSASTPGRVISLVLEVDGAAEMSTDYLDDEEPIGEVGGWVDNGDGTLTLTLSGQEDSDYEVPVEITFAVLDDGSLEATDYDESLYGSEGFTLSPLEDEGAAGVYVSSLLPAADTAGQVVVLILYEDGETQASTFYLNKEAPILEVGTWAEVDSTVTVTVTGRSDSAYDEPQVLTFERDGDALSYLSLVLTRVGESVPQQAEVVAWYQSGVLPAASSPGLQYSLVFFDDSTASMVSDYQNDEAPIVEIGDWLANDDGTITVRLTGRPEMLYEAPNEFTFALDEDAGSLEAVEWDVSLYGSEGMTLEEQPIEDLPAFAEGVGEAAGADAAVADEVAGEAVTTTAEITAPESITLTVPSTEAEESAGASAESDLASLAAPFEVPFGAQAVYASDVLPAADTPGRLVRLVLFDDGSAQMVTDYLNDESPVMELGAWEDNGDETITVSLTGQIDGPYDTPVVITFAQTADGMSSVAWDEALYGSAGLELYTEYPSE